MKRVFDIFLIVLFAPLWLPLMGLVALAVRIFLGRPFFSTTCALGGTATRSASSSSARCAKGRGRTPSA